MSYITNPNPPLPNTPSHRAIWHYGLGDAQVTWLGAHALALSAGAVMFKSQTSVGNESLAHFSFVPDDAVLTSGNAIVGFDYGFPTVPFVNVPPTDGIDAHECPRRTPSAQEMMAHFFITGTLGGAGRGCLLWALQRMRNASHNRSPTPLPPTLCAGEIRSFCNGPCVQPHPDGCGT